MKKAFDDFDTKEQPEEVYTQELPDSFLMKMAVMLELTNQSLQVEVWKN